LTLFFVFNPIVFKIRQQKYNIFLNYANKNAFLSYFYEKSAPKDAFRIGYSLPQGRD